MLSEVKPTTYPILNNYKIAPLHDKTSLTFENFGAYRIE